MTITEVSLAWLLTKVTYLKENWYVAGLAINDDCIEISIGIKAAENPEHDGFYNVSIFVDYSTQEPSVSFDIVW